MRFLLDQGLPRSAAELLRNQNLDAVHAGEAGLASAGDPEILAAEKGSERIREIVGAGEPVATSKIGYAEVYSALTRRRREGDLSARQYTRACRNFEEDWETYVRVDLRDEVLLLARDLIKRRPLRGFDAIHLASALTLGRQLGEPITFVAADARLIDAAEDEKLRVLNPEG